MVREAIVGKFKIFFSLSNSTGRKQKHLLNGASMSTHYSWAQQHLYIPWCLISLLLFFLSRTVWSVAFKFRGLRVLKEKKRKGKKRSKRDPIFDAPIPIGNRKHSSRLVIYTHREIEGSGEGERTGVAMRRMRRQGSTNLGSILQTEPITILSSHDISSQWRPTLHLRLHLHLCRFLPQLLFHRFGRIFRLNADRLYKPFQLQPPINSLIQTTTIDTRVKSIRMHPMHQYHYRRRMVVSLHLSLRRTLSLPRVFHHLFPFCHRSLIPSHSIQPNRMPLILL